MRVMRNLTVLERRPDVAETLPDSPEPESRRAVLLGSLCRKLGRKLGSGAEWLFGLASLVLGLSILAALPLSQFLSLGYFLESSARVARTGRMRDGLIGVRRAARVGGLALGIVLSLIPLWLAGSYTQTAELIDPGGLVAKRGGWAWPL